MERFTKSDTTLVKGVGIILLILHHTIGGNPGIPMSILGTPFYATIGTASKVCVSLFLMLSGIGMAESIRTKEISGYGFVFSRLKKLYFHFWECWLVLFVWSSINGNRPLTDVYLLGLSSDGPKFLIRDLLGFHSFGSGTTPTLNGVFWFMEAIVICYLLFPLLIFFFKNTPKILHVLLLAITYTPWMYYQYKLDFSMHTDRTAFYIFSFCLGIFLSWHNVLGKVKIWSAAHKFLSMLLAAISLVTALFVRQKLCLVFDPFFAVAITVFIICTLCQIKKRSLIKEIIAVYGRCESYLYLFHISLLVVFSSIPFSNIYIRSVLNVLLCEAVVYSYISCRNYLLRFISEKMMSKAVGGKLKNNS